ncbi:MAG: hypothetical protein WCC36_18025 [Gammaproteobacteria bacterium]
MKLTLLTATAVIALCSTAMASAGPDDSHGHSDNSRQYHADRDSHHGDRERTDRKDRVFITNDDGSVSMLERVHEQHGMAYKEVGQVQVGLVAPHWPANQYQGNPNWWWVGVPTGYVRGFELKRGQPLADLALPSHQVSVNAYTYQGVPAGRPSQGESFSGVTPNGKEVWNAAREIDEIQEIDADPHSPTFGQIVTHIPVPMSIYAAADYTATHGRMRPCDMSITPNGKYLFEPDLGGETITAVDIHHKKVVAQLDLTPVYPDARVRPFMLTTNGRIAMVETLEGEGDYLVVDVRDPRHMRVIKRISQSDGLGVRPMTNEFSPDGKYDYMITNGMPADPVTGTPAIPPAISVLDLRDLQIAKNIALPNDCKPYAGDFSTDGRHFFVACSGDNTVAVINTHLQTMVQTVAISGSDPTPRGVLVH